MPSTSESTLKQAAGLSIGSAVVMTLLGILSIVLPGVSGLGVAIFVAWTAILAGIAHVVYAFGAERAGQVLWHLLIGVVYVIGGIFLMVNPGLGLVSLTLLLGAIFIVEGVTRFVIFFRARALPGAGWILLDGVTTVLLGVLVVARWPSDSAWAIGTIFGVNLISSGVTRLMVSVAARRALGAAA